MDEAFIDYLRELFADFGPVSARAMFGGHGLYRDGLIFGIQGKALPMSYWSVPAEAMDSPQAMLPWARRAYDAAMRKPRKPARRRRG